jgi:hypothetical protein
MFANGCGSDSFGTATDQDAASGDATSGSDASSDVIGSDAIPPSADAGECNLSAPFGSPKLITELDTMTANEQTARLTHDELTIYFQEQPIFDAGPADDAGDGGDAGRPPLQLMTATRAQVSDPWGTAIALSTEIETDANDSDPSVTADNLTLYFASDRAGSTGSAGATDLWVATRTTTTGEFGSVNNVGSLNTPSDESEPYVMPDGATIYFRSKRSGNYALYRATTSGTSAFALDNSGLFDGINAAGGIEELPAVTLDELTVYFASDRVGGSGGRDIWKATRTTLNDAFGNPTNITELNTASIDEPSWISDDGCRIYVSSTIGGTADLYVASKPGK